MPCTHTPEINDMHRGVCNNYFTHELLYVKSHFIPQYAMNIEEWIQ